MSTRFRNPLLATDTIRFTLAGTGLCMDTIDGVDNKYIEICGGGGLDSGTGSRGGGMIAYGNESGGGGRVSLYSGTGSGASCEIDARASNGIINLRTAGSTRASINSAGNFIAGIDSGGSVNIARSTFSLSGLSGGTVVSTGARIPAGSYLLGVIARVTTAITGATSWDIGISGGDTDVFGSTLSPASGTTTNHSSFTADPARFSTSDREIILTANGSSFTDGTVKISIYYINFSTLSS